MINGLIEQIKGPKKLTFDHWRYKTLHWCFGINPETKWDSNLPDAFYSHYCPLFHLTNLIVIFSPFIMFVKLILGLVRLIKFGFNKAVKGIVYVFITRKHKPLTEKQIVVRRIKNRIMYYIEENCSKEQTFSMLYSVFSEEYFSKEEFEAYYDAVIKSIEKQKLTDEIKEKEKKALKERMYFWVNFSSIFFKCGLNVLYIFAALLSTWGLYKFAVFISCYSLEFYLSLLWGLIKIFFYAGIIVAGIVFLAFSLERINFKTKSYNMFPTQLAGKWISVFLDFIADTYESVAEFISAFYENNCPPIILEESEKECDESLTISCDDDCEEECDEECDECDNDESEEVDDNEINDDWDDESEEKLSGLIEISSDDKLESK